MWFRWWHCRLQNCSLILRQGKTITYYFLSTAVYAAFGALADYCDSGVLCFVSDLSKVGAFFSLLGLLQCFHRQIDDE